MAADFISGFLSSATLIIAIGTQNAFVLRQGIRCEHVLPIVLFCALADALLTAAGIIGIGKVVEFAPIVLEATRYGGALFLLVYAGVAAWRVVKPVGIEVNDRDGATLGSALTTCAALTLLNPHVYLDTMILLGSIATQRGESGQWVFFFGTTTASVIWFFSLGFGARYLRPLFVKPLSWRILDSFIALIMSSLGLMLLTGI